MNAWTKSVLTVISLFMVALLAGCGGGGGGDSGSPASTTRSATRNLPPDPGAAATATVAGVDTNNNGVRDEVERTLSDKITDDAKYQTTINVAKAYQAVLISTPPTTRAEALKIYGAIQCASGTGSVYGASSNVTTNLTFNTADRKAIISSVNKLLGGGFDGEELPPCQ
jgi:hypothetical protein